MSAPTQNTSALLSISLYSLRYLCSFLADAAIQQSNWDASKTREKLKRDIDAHVLSVRSEKLSELIRNYEVLLFSMGNKVLTINKTKDGFIDGIDISYIVPKLISFNLQKKLLVALTEPIESLFETGGKETWTSIRKILRHEIEVAASAFSSAIAGFELDRETIITMMQNLRDYARNVVEKKAREEAGKVLIRMKDRY